MTCLEYDLKVGPHKQSHIVEEQAKCDSDTAIPLHYEPLKKTTKTGKRVISDQKRSSGPGDLQMTSFTKEGEEQPQGQTWHQLSKGLLFRKAAMTFAAITRGCVNKAEYIQAVKYLKLAMCSFSKIIFTLSCYFLLAWFLFFGFFWFFFCLIFKIEVLLVFLQLQCCC